MIHSCSVDEALVRRVASGLGISMDDIRDSQCVDNGPGWLAVLLDSRARALDLRPDFAALKGLSVGVIGPWDPALDGQDAQFEVRAFVPGLGVSEDPVTGSLNAGLAQWLIGGGRAQIGRASCRGRVCPYV